VLLQHVTIGACSMQVLTFPDVLLEEEKLGMAIPEARIQRIEEKVNPLPGQIDGVKGRLIGVAVVVSFLSAIVLGGGGYLTKEFIDQGKTLVKIQGDIDGIKQGLADVKQIAFAQRLSQVLKNPQNPQNIKETANILASAQRDKLHIDPAIVKETGDKFIATAPAQAASWGVVQQCLNYKSFLDPDFASSLGQLTFQCTNDYPIIVNLRTVKPSKGDKCDLSGTIMAAGGYVKGNEAARMQHLSDLKPGAGGPRWFVLDLKPDVLILDGLFLKNVVVRNSVVEYFGGPVSMQNVYFVNCIFNFKMSPPAIELSKTILATNAVAFSSKGV